ncbi:hypothetical protein C6N75_09770 [Streptomyces solincola]|uniref:Uncharacterized protein n=1 Tax=Streptomyces solincola TaxID=2100817 RepID=A0A2S9PY75_9ACTN|nr:hypothetical protein [Streptomyces solincola]PRH79362.1 hypothetical protein C6N75_09770 [Streptomyces solincola]
MTPKDILLKAAEIIQRDGWHQGSLFKVPEFTTVRRLSGRLAATHAAGRTAPVCAMGALCRATFGTAYADDIHVWPPALMDTYRDAVLALEREVSAPGNSVAHWNDQRERTAEDVILAFKRAAHASD